MTRPINDITSGASRAKNVVAAEVSTPSPPAQTPFWVRAREGIQHLMSTIQHSFHPEGAFPVKVRGVALYGLWSRVPIFPDDLSQPSSDVWERHSRLDLWYATYLVWRPTREGKGRPGLTTTEVHDAFEALLERLDTLVVASTQGTGSGTTPARLVYRILHVEELDPQKPRLYRLRSGKGRKEVRQAEIDVQEAFVEELQRQFGLVEEDPQTGWAPSSFTHYDRNAQRKGWIVVSPQRALVAGVGAGEAHILGSLIQPRDTDRAGKQGGIVPERYEDVLGRIELWNGTQDVAETVSQLEVLVESGKKSIDGQVLLNIALASLGILLTLVPSLHLITWQAAGSFGIILVASLLFWLRARSGHALWLVLGLLLMVAAFLLASAPLWFYPLLHFLSELHL